MGVGCHVPSLRTAQLIMSAGEHIVLAIYRCITNHDATFKNSFFFCLGLFIR